MKALLLPLLLGGLGTGGGVGAALLLAPAPDAEEETSCAESEPVQAAPAPAAPPPDVPSAFAKLNNQFIVPVVEEGRVSAMVVMSMSIEVVEGAQTEVFAREPRLRDGFLRVLFDHANLGGFEGVFTAAAPMRELRAGLLEVARDTVGAERVIDVLITEFGRQDV
ncbi:flagellar basal body-associated FliL family protein [Limimaricola sp. G21655-S1]|uniref:flagellar basal body-associated FliL family protein n=1 Tax=unclassified Limimaricola TaxID=2626459 RepID=UPI0022AEEE05|nr:flagellar basal body-associated FliL family protein [Limimaricola sp. G21655-S1]MCZ4261381.1 flagellar basal body-associated FliL family protein [Limimaricola sp. G21655-S1]